MIALVLLLALFPISGYTTSDTVDPTRFGLALSDGRYRVEAPGGCREFNQLQNVTVWLSEDTPDWVVLTPVDGDTPTCNVHILAKMSETPCFVVDDGRCDVSAESSDAE